MSQIHNLPPWARCLHDALRETKATREDLYRQLELPADGGWLAEALAGQVKPKRVQLALLSACAGIPLAVLEGAVPPSRTLAVALRASLRDAGATDVTTASRAAEAALVDLELLLSWFPQEAARTSIAAREARRAVDRGSFYKDAAARTAERLRDILELNDDPIGDLATIVENLGAAVFLLAMPQSVHGITVHDPNSRAWRAVILINSDTSWARQRYTLAHELCHLLFEDDRTLFITREDVDQRDPVEHRADVFARHFLAPNSAVQAYWEKHGPKTSLDGIGAFLGRFMMDFGLSRPAAIRSLTEVLHLPRMKFKAYETDGCTVEQLMRVAGRVEDWYEACAVERQPASSAWMRSMALNAFRAGLVGADLVARVLGRPEEVDTVERELRENGWSPVEPASGWNR